MTVYVVMADCDRYGDGRLEAVFADRLDAERYSTMGDMEVRAATVTPKGEEPQTVEFGNALMSGSEEFIWTGKWADAIAFMDRCTYAVPFLGTPAIRLHEPDVTELCVYNIFTRQGTHARIGDKVVWHPVTRSFTVEKT